jgi:hypothetical protein
MKRLCLSWSLCQKCQVMHGHHQVLRSVMPGLKGATHDRSSVGFKLCRLVVLGGMVPRGLGGDRACVGHSMHDSDVVWHHSGVDGWPGIGLYFVVHLGGGFAKDKDGGANSGACAYDALSSFGW